jgi:hypothetical protein
VESKEGRGQSGYQTLLIMPEHMPAASLAERRKPASGAGIGGERLKRPESCKMKEEIDG